MLSLLWLSFRKTTPPPLAAAACFAQQLRYVAIDAFDVGKREMILLLLLVQLLLALLDCRLM